MNLNKDLTQIEMRDLITYTLHSKGINLKSRVKTRPKKRQPRPRSKSQIGKVSDLEELLRINTELGINRDLNKALQIYVKRAAAFMHFHRAFLGIVEDGKCKVRFSVDRGKSFQYDFALDRG